METEFVKGGAAGASPTPIRTRVRPPVRAVLLALALLAGGACGGPGHGQRPLHPNLVLISVDTLNQAALRAYSDAARALPSLDAFADQSIRFSNAWSTASWTLPAHASLLTGLYPDRHGATDHRVAVASGAPHLASALRAAGYETVAFTGGGYMGADYGLDAGFDRYNGAAAAGRLAELELPRDGAYDIPPGTHLFDRARAYLRGRPADAPPFFLFVHTYSVHDYFTVSPWALSDAPDHEDLDADRYLSCLKGWIRCPPEAFRRLEQLYRSELAHLDRALGELLATLADMPGGKDTVVVLLSDHGEGFDDARGRIHHGGRLNADQLRVPLLFRIPGEAPRSIDAPVSLVDVAPTLLELAGSPLPDSLDGRSLLPLIDGGPPPPERPILAMEHYYAWTGAGRQSVAEIQARPMAIAVLEHGLWYIAGQGGEELYDSGRDPQQTHSLLPGASGPELERLRGAAAKRLRDRPQTPVVDETPELRESLRALGYAE
jgi:choline-sulfatase